MWMHTYTDIHKHGLTEVYCINLLIHIDGDESCDSIGSNIIP